MAGSLRAQVPAINTDSLFKQAQQLAYSHHYEDSRKLSREVLHLAPAYTDASLLIARTFAWEHQYDSARLALVPLLKVSPPLEEALLLAADVELWSGLPEQALTYVTPGLRANPASIPFQLRKARALYALKDYKSAANVLTTLLEQEPQNKEALTMLEEVQEGLRTNSVQAGYQVTTFDDGLDPWHLGSLEYTHQASGVKYVARASYAQRYGDQSVQGEVEAYPEFGKGTYAYLNVGASDQQLFPSFRTGAELYHLFPHKIEASLGARGLFFPDETVVLYTGYIGKYFTKQWVSFRPFLQRMNNSWQATGILQLRQYLKHEDEYISLVLATGSVPFEQVGFQEIRRLSSNRAGLEGQFRAGNKVLIGGIFSYEYEEYARDQFRNRFTVGITVEHKF
jgi:YaiO family outer membrane protein